MRKSQLQAATEVFSYKWYPAIVHAVYELEGAGYSEIEVALDGVSSKMLSDGLSDLCERNIITETETVEGSGRKVYHLSTKGRALVSIIHALEGWKESFEESQQTVLIVEDERMVAEVLSEYLTDTHDIRYAETGQEALSVYTDDIGLVIVDRRLEGMSGDEVARRIRSQNDQELILCVSGVEPDDDIVELGFDDYIHKPVEDKELTNRIGLLFNRVELDSTAREYLSVRSKQLTLTDVYGNAARKMEGYKNCTSRIEELDIPPRRKETLESLLPH